LKGKKAQLKNTLQVINELKEKGLLKDYAIGGAIGTLRWVEPFFTRDLDIFIVLKEKSGEGEVIVLSPIYEELKKRGYIWEGHWIMIEGIPVDIFPADELEEKAIENGKETEYEGVKTKVMTPEYLIALFLRANRHKDKRKIQMLLEQSEIDEEKLKEILREFGLTGKFDRFKEEYYGSE